MSETLRATRPAAAYARALLARRRCAPIRPAGTLFRSGANSPDAAAGDARDDGRPLGQPRYHLGRLRPLVRCGRLAIAHAQASRSAAVSGL